MKLVLASYGRMFATRERAREILATVVWDQSSCELDLERVTLSPSFAAELIVGLASHCEIVSVERGTEHSAHLIQSLAEKFGMTDKFRIAQLA